METSTQVDSSLKPESWAWHLLGFVTPAVVISGNLWGSAWTAAGAVLTLVVYPLLDGLSGENRPARPAPEKGTALEVMLHLHSCLHWVLVGSLCYRAWQDGSAWTTWMAAASTGIASGISGIIVAHELGHKRPRSLSWWMGRLNLFLVLYSHYTLEHNVNHHKTVATPDDPASAPKGRGFWFQLARSLTLQFVSSWHLANAQLEKHGRRTWFGVNSVFHGLLLQAGLLAAIGWSGGRWVLAAFCLQAALSVFLLEYVNYIRHYGLVRQPNEKQTEAHSWQTEKRLSRWTLLELTRHPAHHLKASQPFWKLTPYADSPNLPSGYYALFWPCLIPPLWRRWMDGRVPPANAE